MHTVDVHTALFEVPITFEFASRAEAEAFREQVMTYGLHLNVKAAEISAPEGENQTLNPEPLGVRTRLQSPNAETNGDG